MLGLLYTARVPDELLVEVEVPEQPGGAGSGFAEYAHLPGTSRRRARPRSWPQAVRPESR